MNKHSILILFFLLISLANCQLDAEDTGNYGGNGLDYDIATYKWGFIDKNGEEVIAGRYDDCQDFQENRAAVRLKDQWGYIDRQGTEVIPLQYKAAWSFKDGLARVLTMANEMGFINLQGDWVIAPATREMKDFS